MINRINRRITRSALAVAAAMFCATVALAQQAPVAPAGVVQTPDATSNTPQTPDGTGADAASATDADTTASGAKQQSLDTIIVTAQKREQAAIDVPASVTALSAQQLSRAGLTRVADYAAEVPGMSVTRLSRGYSSVVIRGISTGISQATPSTAYYIDEAPIGSINAYAVGSTITPDLDPYDLRRIEVLKGPQGTLYGAGAVGGLVRYVTQPPDTQKFGGSVSVGVNSVSEGGNGSDARVAVNIPLAENTMGLRASAFTRTEAGYIDNSVTGEKDQNEARTNGGRLAWDWKFAEGWDLTMWGLAQHFAADGIGAENVDGATLKPLAGELTRGNYVPETQQIDLEVYNATVRGMAGRFDIVSATTYQTVDSEQNVDQTPLYGFLVGAALGVPNLGAETHQFVHTQRWSEELRAHSTAFDDRLDYDGGFYYTKEDSLNRIPSIDTFLTPSATPFPLPVPVAIASIRSQYEEYSAFANGTWSFTPQFDLQAGVRFAHDNQHYAQNYAGLIVGPVPVVFDKDISHDKTTYLLSGRFKPDADTEIYARVATGYRPGGPNAVPPSTAVPGVPQSFEPDTLISYELGYKAVFDEGRLSFEGALFTTDWDKIQIQTSAGGFNFFVNGGSATSQGAEATLLFFPVDGFKLRATASYTDTTLSENAPAAGGLDGDRMPFVPQWTGSLGAEYAFALGAWQAYVGGSLNFIGDRRSNFSQKNAIEVPSYTTLNLNAGVDFGQWRLSFYGKNLNDSRGVNFVNATGVAIPGLNPLGNPYVAGVIEPRTVGVEATWKF